MKIVADKSIIELKKQLDEWLTEYSDKYKETERLATLNNYRKAIYLYITLAVQAVITHKY